MKYEIVKSLNDADFKRSTGVSRRVFAQMLPVVENGLRHWGRPPKLSRADQLLMTLMYWREYRTEFHIGLAYGVSEATVCRTVRKIEDLLIQSKQFHLPGRKALHSSDTAIEIILVDATEQPIERPQKNSGSPTAVRRNDIPRKPKSLPI
jgi:hypothetical protein